MSVHTNLFFGDGTCCNLGRRLGTGGEGAVFELQPLGQKIVAKVYHRPIKPDKQKKLISMARECDDAIKRIAAWPVASLHYGRGGPVCGFTMPKVSDYEPIHKLYGPTHRKQVFPEADWAFLVNAARNLAAAFEVIHSHGHVVADVNQGNVVVAASSVVKFIDCDSFQISVGGSRHFCEVGVLHFTPPELQSLKSFHGAERTQNHDNFGLALLCFHLLFMGRHPFAGVYSGREDMPIERAVREFRFAFGKNASLKGMKPPPNTVGLDVVSPGVASFFERAFSEAGVQNGRPKASDWLRILEALKSEIRTCQVESVHKYYGGLASCPWCALERKSGVLFFISVITATPVGGVFNLAQVWQRIGAVASSGEAPSVTPGSFSASPKPLPPQIRHAKTWKFVRRIIAIGVVFWCLQSFPSAFIIVLIFALILFFWRGEGDSKEKKARQDALRIAETKWEEAEKRWSWEAGEAAFKDKLKEATKLRGKYENLNNEYATEKQKLQAVVKEKQLQKFLDTFFIQDHSIPKIGAGRKATLASFGIETAADVDPGKILNISGFGHGLTNELVQWRTGLERKFKFDPSKGIDPADINALNQKFRQERKQIEGGLLAAPEILNKVREQTLLKRNALRPQIEDVAKALVQARADLSVFR